MPELTFKEEEIKALAKEIVKELIPLLKSQSKDDEILDFNQACEFLKCKKTWLYSKVSNNEIPYIKTGKYLKFRKSELSKWLEKNISFKI
ncbi:helix-turn-helix domain-containing protein [Thermodesulfovibrio sp. TK110]